MDYFIAFLEGIITFISPCLLPMIPIYITYFAGQEMNRKRTAVNALGFIAGFTIIFVLMGAFAGTMGRFLSDHTFAMNLIMGIVMILFGLNFMELIRLPLISQNRSLSLRVSGSGFFRSLLFGMIFSVGWTPCAGAFLGSALMLAASAGHSAKGVAMLLCYSLGLGIPFFASALLTQKLKTAFDFIKRHYLIINRISGIFLILVGILMASGLLGYFLALLTPAAAG